MNSATLLRRIRFLLIAFMVALFVSGVTAIPLETELRLLAGFLERMEAAESWGLYHWVVQVRDGLIETNAKYPFMAYGTDWLAFGHFVIAIAFAGPLRDPVKNIWVIEFGMISCVLVVPYALVMGGLREIPLGWRLIDCSFGVIGIVPLWFCAGLFSGSPGSRAGQGVLCDNASVRWHHQGPWRFGISGVLSAFTYNLRKTLRT